MEQIFNCNNEKLFKFIYWICIETRAAQCDADDVIATLRRSLLDNNDAMKKVAGIKNELLSF